MGHYRYIPWDIIVQSEIHLYGCMKIAETLLCVNFTMF